MKKIKLWKGMYRKDAVPVAWRERGWDVISFPKEYSKAECEAFKVGWRLAVENTGETKCE